MDGWASSYVGIPFREHGRDREGCDCYGLVRLVLSEEFGRSLPALLAGYDDFSDRAAEAQLVTEGLSRLARRREGLPLPGDIVHLAYFGHPSHVGIYAGDHRMLHVSSVQGYASIDDLASPMLRNRVKGYYYVD